MTPALVEQRELQRRFHSRALAWLVWASVLGFGLSGLGLLAAARLARLGVPLSGFRQGVLWFGFLYFGLALALIATVPLRLRPRIVPCFRQSLESYGGASSAAFRRGHALYRECEALDTLARNEHVEPLSSFGFADDHYGQPVRWHAAAAGARTVAALRARAPASVTADLAADLAALASVLEISAARGVEFSLRLRLQRGDLQAVASWEVREGGFW